MIEAPGQGPASGLQAAAQSPAGGPTAGMLLREGREAAGWHAATLAAALKVPLRKLEALETDRFDLLPDAVFVRALAASVCRTLKLDPAPILQLLPAGGAPRLAASEAGINAPFRSPRDGARPTWIDQLSRPVVLVVAALLLGALAVFLLPSHRDQGDQGDPADAQAESPAPAAVPAPEAVSEASSEAVAASAVPASASPPIAAGPVTAAVPSIVGAPVVAPVARAAASAPVAPAFSQAEGIVVFKAQAQSWIQVTDGKGNVALRKLLAAGESASATGALPLTVTVGSVSATQVEVRGQPFDLAALARDNVARFEVK
jgi:cytoskeleton protein RodZ